MSDGLLALLAAAAGLLLVRAFHRDALREREKTERYLARWQPVEIAAISEGLVRVTGRVRPHGELLRGPVTGRPCVAFHLKIERKVSRYWEIVVEDRAVPPFVVQDGTGEVLVDTSGPLALALVPDAYGSNAWLGEAKLEHMRAVRRLVAAHVHPLVRTFGTFSFEEALIEAGDELSIRGLATRQPAPDGERPTPRAPPERIVLSGTAEEPLAISD